MKIPVTCPDGHKISVPQKYAGRAVKCPKCGQRTQVPADDEFDDDFEESYLDDLLEEQEAAAEQQRARKQRREQGRQQALAERAKAAKARVYSLIAGVVTGLLVVGVVGWLLLPGPS